jgi:predicted dehydrogenase
MAGLAALYWPVALANGIRDREGVSFTAAATLGVSNDQIRAMLGMAPEEYAAKYGLRLYTGAEDMIAEVGLDTLVLVTRHSEHAAWAERLAPLVPRMFIPKTFATTVEDAQRIVDAGRRHGTQIAVGPSARFLPAMRAVKRAIDDGLIGRPFSLRICHHHGTIDVFHPGDWYRDAREGGPELSLGWYGIDLVLHLLSGEARTVYAEYGNFTSPDSPFMDCGRMQLQMADGRLASFDMYFCNRVPYPSWQIEVLGPGGVVSIHRAADDARQTVVGLDSAEGHRLLPLDVAGPGWETFWVDDFLAGREPTVDAALAARITRISLAARQSAREGRPVAM